jgi:glyoxylase-like metal-dependent hydrolase (beta-lactamase superfamily II)
MPRRRGLLRRVVTIVFVLGGIAGALIWFVAGRIGVEQVAPDLYMMTGMGGNVGVLVTDEGVVVVDTMTFVRQGNTILARIRELTDKPVMAVINTHYHQDHTHGNPAFPYGTKVVATTNTLKHLKERDADFWRDPPAANMLPDVTVDASQEISLGGRTVRVFHPGRGHTDGDLVVLFVEQRVLQAGDLVWNGYYPNIDLEAGGSVAEWPATLDRAFALEFDRVIPGHGPVFDRAGASRFQDFVATLWRETKAVKDRGGSLDDALDAVDLSRFGLRTIWFVPSLNRRFVIRRAWEELSGPRG